MSRPTVPWTSPRRSTIIPQRHAASAPNLLHGESSMDTPASPSQMSDVIHTIPTPSTPPTHSSYNLFQQEHGDTPSSFVRINVEDLHRSQGSREDRRGSVPPDLETQNQPNTSQDNMNLDVFMERLRRNTLRQQGTANGPSLQGIWNMVRGVFGYGPAGTLARKQFVSVLSKIMFGIGQIAAVIALSVIASGTESPSSPDENEWEACHRPLGVWAILWAFRVLFGTIVIIWMYHAQCVRNRETAARIVARRTRFNAGADAYDPERFEAIAGLAEEDTEETQPPVRPINPAINRLSSFLSLLSVAWFIVAHILLYTSTNSCRISSPHLWWLTFGIVCIGYLVFVEVGLVVVLVFIVGPILFLIVNLILICLGREPIHARSKSEVGKLSAKAVDSIPLVLYIPAPTTTGEETGNTQGDPKSQSITAPEPAHVHSYPPETQRPLTSSHTHQGTRVQSRSKRLFTFRRIRRKSNHDENTNSDNKDSAANADEGNSRYEDKWEKGEYPFVKLEENRTTCAICLCDFEEPRRVRYSIDSKPPESLAEAEAGAAAIDLDIPSSHDSDGRLRLADPGEGAQPLRLLECAHVFHKTCIDPWLIEVSGRCPVCQKPVEVKEPPKARRSRRQE